MIMDINKKPAANAEFLFKELDDGCVLYEPANEKIHSLNSTAAYIWTMCNGNNTIEKIVESVNTDFKNSETDVSKQVIKIVEKFYKLNIVA